jgi:hypothetical protein
VARLVASIAIIGIVATGCGLGQRPTIVATPTAVGAMTGDAAIDDILTRLDNEADAVFTASYTAVLAFGSTTSAVTVTQDGSEPTVVRRSVTIGDVRYITTPDKTSTCSVVTAQCLSGIDASRVSDTGVTPDFAFGDMAKRLRRDAAARIGTAVASTRQVAGATATCVDLPVTGGTKQYCAFDDGALARYVGGDLTIDVDSYRRTVDDALFVV